MLRCQEVWTNVLIALSLQTSNKVTKYLFKFAVKNSNLLVWKFISAHFPAMLTTLLFNSTMTGMAHKSLWHKETRRFVHLGRPLFRTLGTSCVMHKRFLSISFTDLLSPNVHWAVSERVRPDRNSRTTYEYKDYSISMFDYSVTIQCLHLK